jgi:hypothetical protein
MRLYTGGVVAFAAASKLALLDKETLTEEFWLTEASSLELEASAFWLEKALFALEPTGDDILVFEDIFIKHLYNEAKAIWTH